MVDIASSPASDIDPYAVLGVSESASAADIKSAYKKLALKHHPDKVAAGEKESSKVKFQEIVSAYAILSDERRRKRYDTTGNTSESLNIDDDDFDWLDFFRAQWGEAITTKTIQNMKENYQGSTEEKRDVIAAFVNRRGNMTRVFQDVMLCNVLDDEDRFRSWIDEEIASNRVENFDGYRLETEASKKKRRKAAEKEAKEAEAHLNHLNESKKKKDKNGMGDLASMIQQRQQSRATNFLDDLEAKYAPKGPQKKGATGRKRKLEDEPSEEAFQKAAQKLQKTRDSNGKVRAKGARRNNEDSEDETVDLEAETGGSDSEDSSEPEPQSKASKKGRKAAGKATAAGKRRKQSKL